MRTLLLGICCLILMQACSGPSKIIFTSDRYGNADIFEVQDNGRKLLRLTQDSVEEWGPTILNEREITYLAQEEEGIFRYKLDLITGQRKIINQPTNCILDDKNMVYSPLTKRQLYECKGEVYMADAEGTTIRHLTEKLKGISAYVSWSADERYVLLTNNSTGNNDIYRLDLDNETWENLTNHPANDERGSLSPDGKYLLFSSSREKKNQDLFLMNLETREIRNLTSSKAVELIGRWSKNGKTIIYGSNEPGNWDIFSLHIKSGKKKQLTFSDSFDGDPRVR